MSSIAPPPVRLISWLQLCQEADPNYNRDHQQPWIYDFSNGRIFLASIPTYVLTTST